MAHIIKGEKSRLLHAMFKFAPVSRESLPSQVLPVPASAALRARRFRAEDRMGDGGSHLLLERAKAGKKGSLEIRREGSQCFADYRRAMGVPHSMCAKQSA